MAMLGIGLEVNFKEIGSRGLRAFGLGISIFAVIGVVGITMVLFLVA
ncbi:hypothetical protein [Anaerosolibacter sp.]|jgi:uncharacterized membrane protein YadS|nr:hypothetical protein [Anaerosolibacter sp.]